METVQSLISGVFSGVFRLAFRLVLLAMGLVFAASLLLVVLALAVAWGLRATWARLTGQPVNPWVMKFNPGAGWSRFAQQAVPPLRSDRGLAPGMPGAVEVIDVEAKIRP